MRGLRGLLAARARPRSGRPCRRSRPSAPCRRRGSPGCRRPGSRRRRRAPSGRARPSRPTGMNCRGTAPPTTLSTNSKPDAGRQRLDLDVADRELAVAAGLLDVPAVALGRAGERLAQRHPQRHRVDGDAVAVAQPVEQHVDVRLAHAPQHQLVGLGVVLEPQRRVLGDQPRQALRRACPRRPWSAATTATGSSGSGISHGSISSGSSLSDSVSPVSARVSLATAHDVAGDGAAATVRCVLPSGDGQRADPLVDVVVLVARASGRSAEVAGHVHGRVRAQRAGEDPDQARSGRRTGRSWS